MSEVFSKEYGYGKEFNTRQLLGETVVVATRVPSLELKGVLLEFYERNQAIALKKYEITLRRDDGTVETVEKGDIIIMKQDSWLTMRAKTVMNRKLLA
jgi:hypothetical protein